MVLATTSSHKRESPMRLILALLFAVGAAACVIVALSMPAHAADACVKVELLVKQATEEYHINPDAIYTLQGAGQVSDYAKFMGITLPDDSQPTGLLFVEAEAYVIVGIIEIDCIRYSARVNTEAHKRAIAAVMKGA